MGLLDGGPYKSYAAMGLDPKEMQRKAIFNTIAQLGIGLLSGKNWGQGIGQGLLNAQGAGQQAQEDAMKQAQFAHRMGVEQPPPQTFQRQTMPYNPATLSPVSTGISGGVGNDTLKGQSALDTLTEEEDRLQNPQGDMKQEILGPLMNDWQNYQKQGFDWYEFVGDRAGGVLSKPSSSWTGEDRFIIEQFKKLGGKMPENRSDISGGVGDNTLIGQGDAAGPPMETSVGQGTGLWAQLQKLASGTVGQIPGVGRVAPETMDAMQKVERFNQRARQLIAKGIDKGVIGQQEQGWANVILPSTSAWFVDSDDEMAKIPGLRDKFNEAITNIKRERESLPKEKPSASERTRMLELNNMLTEYEALLKDLGTPANEFEGMSTEELMNILRTPDGGS